MRLVPDINYYCYYSLQFIDIRLQKKKQDYGIVYFFVGRLSENFRALICITRIIIYLIDIIILGIRFVKNTAISLSITENGVMLQ